MSDLMTFAQTHRLRRIDLREQTFRRLERLWQQVDPNQILRSFESVLRPIVDTVASAQKAAARQSSAYANQVDSYFGINSPEQIVEDAFAGVDQWGQPLADTLSKAPVSVLAAIRRGLAVDDAMVAGRSRLLTAGGTSVLDSGRAADRTNTIARKQYTTWIRMIGPGACSRCVALAGMHSWKTPFARHPNCRCTAIPTTETYDGAAGTDPGEYFDRLSTAEQDRRFTKAGAEAIRQGADMNRVVNARRGASGISYGPFNRRTSGRMTPTNIGTERNPVWVYTTKELHGRSSARVYQYPGGVRLMPESIIDMAGGDRARSIELLKQYGYIYPTPAERAARIADFNARFPR